jgi:ribonuclease-3 family protein
VRGNAIGDAVMINTNFDSGMLSYLGDAVWELLVREHIFKTIPHGNKKANKLALSYVTAKSQCSALDKILPNLTEEELEVFKWGRNTKVNSIPRSATPEEYHKATGLEVLFGYLHITENSRRYRELFQIAFQTASNC